MWLVILVNTYTDKLVFLFFALLLGVNKNLLLRLSLKTLPSSTRFRGN